jgi:hypothetical protein
MLGPQSLYKSSRLNHVTRSELGRTLLSHRPRCHGITVKACISVLSCCIGVVHLLREHPLRPLHLRQCLVCRVLYCVCTLRSSEPPLEGPGPPKMASVPQVTDWTQTGGRQLLLVFFFFFEFSLAILTSVRTPALGELLDRSTRYGNTA